MNKTSRFLAAMDGSAQAMSMIRYLGSILSVDHSEVVIRHVFNKIPDSFWDMQFDPDPYCRSQVHRIRDWESKEKSKIMAACQLARQALLDAGFSSDRVQVKILERIKGVARDILAESHEGYVAVTIGALGMSEVPDLVLGGVAEKLLSRMAHLTLAIVHGNPSPEKILMAVDGSAGSGRAVQFLPLLMNGEERTVTLFHALRPLVLPITSESPPPSPEEESDYLEERSKVIREVMDEAANLLEQSGINRERIQSKIALGVPSRAEAIVRESQSGGYGTIVMGRKGLTEVDQFPMGRVCNKVVHMARQAAVWVVA